MWTKIKAGKHTGKTLPKVLFSDPDYFFWASEKRAFQGRLAIEAANLARKARRIKIPKPDPQNWRVEYFFTAENKFSRCHLVPANRPEHIGHSPTKRLEYFDMFVVRSASRYDKGGYKRYLENMKYYLFGDRSVRMTARRCEEFFENDENFEL